MIEGLKKVLLMWALSIEVYHSIKFENFKYFSLKNKWITLFIPPPPKKNIAAQPLNFSKVSHCTVDNEDLHYLALIRLTCAELPFSPQKYDFLSRPRALTCALS